MRLTEAFNWFMDPDADSGRYTHFDPATGVDTVRGRVIDCTGEPTLYAVEQLGERLGAIKRPFADFGKRQNGADLARLVDSRVEVGQ